MTLRCAPTCEFMSKSPEERRISPRDGRLDKVFLEDECSWPFSGCLYKIDGFVMLPCL